MSNIEPTEEQKQAAGDLYSTKELWLLDGWWVVDAIARLLAEREAKLREEYQARAESFVDLVLERQMLQEDLVTARTENDTLRARVAEMEASDAHLRKLLAEERGNVGAQSAQHLADIKALMEALKGFLVPAALTIEFNPGVRARALLQRLAHYDDAKAAEGGEANTEHVVMLSHDHAGNDTVDVLCEKMVWRDCYEATAAVLTRPVAEGMKQQLWPHGNIQILGVKAYLKGVAEQNLADVLWRAAHEVEGVDRLTKGET